MIDEVVAADAAADFEVDITGVNTLDHDFTELSESDLTNGELKFGLPAAMIVLVLVFGALVAAFIPMSIAILSIIVTVAISSVLGQFTSLSFFIVNMITAMGLALGIDYSLFVLSRYREERQAGRDKIDAIIATGGTSSKAVLFSGSSFVVALLGLLLVPDTILRSLALGAIIVGVVTMAAAITLLPALLSLLGDRVNALRLPIVGRDHPAESPFWTRAVGAVVRRPGTFLAAGVLVLLAAAFPVLGLHTGTAGVNSLPDDTFAKAGALALERSFPGTSTTDPAQVVVSGDVASTDVTAAIERFEASIADDPDFGPAQQQIAENGQVAVISIPLVGDPDHSQARRGLDRLRTDLIPAAFDGTDTSVLVGGTTAENVDYSDVINKWLPIVLAFVLGLSFILLTLVFRSVVVSATAVVLNLLSVGAAYGLLVLVFQHGVGADLLGFQQVERVEAWVPVFLFSVLFALSMDYHVFLLSRIRERYAQTGDTNQAVVHGIAATGRIITGAALIIVVVFAGFAAGQLVMFQQMGFGVGVALLVDATLIRMVVVPAAMAVLGQWNWYLPSWLNWLPELHVEGDPEAESARSRRPRIRSREGLGTMTVVDVETSLVATPVRAQLLATEHWSLLATRGMTWSEVMSRITVHLTVASAALVVLALVTQATGFGVAFHVLSIGLTSAILVLGTLTGVRVHNASREDAAIILGMNRLRAAYVEMDPGIAEYLVTSQYDDQAGLMTTYTMGMRRSTVSHVVGSTSMFINIVNAIVAGTLGALIADAAGGDAVATSLAGIVAGVAYLAMVVEAARRSFAQPPAARTLSDWLGLGRRGTTGRGRVVDSAHAPELARCRSGRATAGRATRSSMVGIRPPRGFDLARRRVHRRRRLRAAVPIAATPGPFVVGGRGGRGCRAVRVRHERQRTEGVALEGRAPAQGSGVVRQPRGRPRLVPVAHDALAPLHGCRCGR